MDFYTLITDDGSISLYNTKINDIYHSKVGAYTETLEKFIYPSGILDRCAENNHVNILDICFGLGYNSLLAIHKINEINSECIIRITAIEIDPKVLAYSYFITHKNVKICLIKAFRRVLYSNKSIRQEIYKIKNNSSLNLKMRHKIMPHFSPNKNKNIYKVIFDKNNSILHNIYYRSISKRNIINSKISYNTNFAHFTIYIEDIRKVVNNLIGRYDYVFHDPFTPSKVPGLWSVDIFRALNNKIDNNGCLVTYSSSAAVRSGLIEAGFFIGRTDPVGRKSSGTIAFKNNSLLINNLSKIEREILNTKSGIPYYDLNLNSTDKEILDYRKELVNNSSRITASQYFKHNKRGIT